MAQPLIPSPTMSAEEAGMKAARQLWTRSGPLAVTKPAQYERALRDLPDAARQAFDRELLRLALADRRIFTPRLPRHKPPPEGKPVT